MSNQYDFETMIQAINDVLNGIRAHHEFLRDFEKGLPGEEDDEEIIAPQIKTYNKALKGAKLLGYLIDQAFPNKFKSSDFEALEGLDEWLYNL